MSTDHGVREDTGTDTAAGRMRCDFCGCAENIPVFLLQDWMTRKPGSFQLVRCAQCGLLFLNPRLSWEELEDYYPDEYHAYRSGQKRKKNRLIEQVKRIGMRRRARAIGEYLPGGKILDVGCATGEFLVEMGAENKWECYGVEPVKFAADLARRQSRAQIFEGILLDSRYPDAFFDAVTMWDVLEHTPNPAQTLHELQRILRPGGLLVIRVPNPGSMLAQLFRQYWIAYDAPRHLFDFPKHVMEHRLSSEGFDVLEHKYLNSEHYVFFASLSALFYGAQKERLGNLAYRAAYSTPLRMILAPLFLPLKWLKLGSAPAYFARKHHHRTAGHA